MRDRRRNVRSGLLGFLMVLLVTSTSLGYPGQARVSVTVSARVAVVPCYQDVRITATVLQAATNAPVKNKSVRWEITTHQSRYDGLSKRKTDTNGAGKAAVVLTFGYKPGLRVSRATVDGVSGTTTVRCTLGWWHDWRLDHWASHASANAPAALGGFNFFGLDILGR